MTGFGEAQCQDEGLIVTVELRTINNRYFKFNLRSSEGYSLLEPQIEAVIRERIKRGTVQAILRVERTRVTDTYSLNLPVLAAYHAQVNAYLREHQLQPLGNVEAILPLPGVVNEASVSFAQAEAAWPLIEKTTKAALQALDKMRTDEGKNMARDLATNCQTIATEVEAVAARAH